MPLRTAGRVVDGYLVELGDEDDADRPLSELDDVVSSVAVLTPALYALARRAADRAAGSASDILRLAIPRRMVRAEKAWLAGDETSAPVVTEESVARSSKTLAVYPALEQALSDGARVAVDATPSLARLPDGTDVGAWSTLLAAVGVQTLARGKSAILVVPDVLRPIAGFERVDRT